MKPVYFFSLSFFHSLHYDKQKKHISLLSANIGTNCSNYGKQIPLETYTDTYTYSLFLLSVVDHRSSWSSSFIYDNNENVFMKRNQRGSFY
jgi:hypothetical protein